MADIITNRPHETQADLLPHHREELHASGLTDEVIAAAGVYSETAPEKLTRLLGWRSTFPSRCAPALVFPFTDAEGQNGYYRVKPDTPRVCEGKPIKYESPVGRPNEVYLPPGVAGVLDDVTAQLYITEGEKKSLAATQSGFPCLGLVGVYGWKEAKKEELLPALERLGWRGRRVFIVFDSDIATNPGVLDAESRLARMLTQRGAQVRVVRLPAGPAGEDGKPAKVGLDDFLVAQGAGEFRKLIDAAQEPAPVSPVQLREAAGGLDAAQEANDHYLQTTDQHYADATAKQTGVEGEAGEGVQGGTACGTSGTENVAQ